MSASDRPPEPLPTKEQEEPASDSLPQLGALEEDDEFEEFAVQDWDDAETDLSHITAGTSNVGSNPSGSNAGGAGQDTLWEDNWDDDDIEDDFSKQLREELANAGNTAVDTPMH